MKDAEDEAFDEIARKQGAWGGGFQTKRKMAADKVQDETDMLTIAYLDGYERGKKTVQREWVGLTDEEIDEGNKQSWVTKQAWESAVWWASEKLKEKNNG